MVVPTCTDYVTRTTPSCWRNNLVDHMKEELEAWVLEQKKELWQRYIEGKISYDTLIHQCGVLDELFGL